MFLLAAIFNAMFLAKCRISETMTDKTNVRLAYYKSLMISAISFFRWDGNHRPWMTVKNSTAAETISCSVFFLATAGNCVLFLL